MKKCTRCSSALLAGLFLAILLITSFGAANLQATTYYVDSVGGNDTNTGTSTGAAWSSLRRVSLKPNGELQSFNPGDQILFKAGCSWTGQLICRGVGSETGGAIVVDKYGSGPKPILNGNGALSTIYMENKSSVGFTASPYGYWEINNLEITNTPATPGDVSGIYVSNWNGGKIDHLYFKNLYIHDINGNNPGSGGIIFNAWGWATPSWFNDVKIEYCSLYNIGRAGIVVSKGNWCDRHLLQNGVPAPQFYPSTKVFIKNNYLDEIGGDGIIAQNSEDAKVEYNLANRCASKSESAHVAFWPFASKNAQFQYNEASNTAILGPNSHDSQGYDCDWDCDGTLFQYNYSRNNQGGFMLICCDGENKDRYGNPALKYNNGSIVRYNVSENDGRHTIRVSGQTKNAQIYNNTIYIGTSAQIDPSKNRIFYIKANFGQYPQDISFTNNLIHNKGSGRYEKENGAIVSYVKNCFFNDGVAKPSGQPGGNNLTENPLLVSPGNGGTITLLPTPGTVPSIYPETNMSNSNRLPAYKLQVGSPCINSGEIITGNGGKDFWGASLYNGAPDIGACEYTPPSLPVVIEAESGARSGGTTVNNLTAASGGKAVKNFITNGASVTWSGISSTGGAKNVTIRYTRYGTSTNKSIYVNGIFKAHLTFPATGTWSTPIGSITASIIIPSGSNNSVTLVNDPADDDGDIYCDTVTINP